MFCDVQRSQLGAKDLNFKLPQILSNFGRGWSTSSPLIVPLLVHLFIFNFERGWSPAIIPYFKSQNFSAKIIKTYRCKLALKHQYDAVTIPTGTNNPVTFPTRVKLFILVTIASKNNLIKNRRYAVQWLHISTIYMYKFRVYLGPNLSSLGI